MRNQGINTFLRVRNNFVKLQYFPFHGRNNSMSVWFSEMEINPKKIFLKLKKKSICYVPIAVVTNYHKLSSLKEHELITLQFWRSEVWIGHFGAKIKRSAGLCFFCKFSGRLFPAFSRFQRLPVLLGSWPLPSSSEHISPTSDSSVSSPSSAFALLPRSC